MKYKHNKRKNSSILYEILIQELAKTIVSKDKDLRNKILETIKKYFNRGSLLGKELRIYNNILNTNNVDQLIAEKIVMQSKKDHESLDKNKIAQEQNNLFFEIKKYLPTDKVFFNFIPNYRSLASISQIFNRDVSAKTRVLLEQDMVNKMSSNLLNESNKMQSMDKLVLNSFINKYNKEYTSLYEEQKQLLNKFIKSFVDNGLELKIFLNEEIKRLKQEVNKSLTTKEFTNDNVMSENAKKVLEKLNGFSKEIINEQMIKTVIKIQNLIREINN